MSVYKGIDVSRWQEVIDWAKVKNNGIDFAIIRASFGSGENQKDAYFEENYRCAKRAGMPLGAYHYSYATSVADALKEAEHFYSVIKGKQFEYPVVYDMEEDKIASLGKKKISEIALAFCEKMESYGYYVMIYANKFWLDNYFTDEIFDKYDIWLAQWTTRPTFERVYGIWQKSSKGRVEGISGYVDIDEAYKNYPAIMKLNGLNGFQKSNGKPAQGKKVTLKNVKLYGNSKAAKETSVISGEYYIYDGKLLNGRYRITNSSDNVGKTPIGKYVTGFVKAVDLE